MAVVIASALDKDMAGSPLFPGGSLKPGGGGRGTPPGRHRGGQKTTLLRMMSNETGLDGGELVFEKGTRVALHDQRPPRERDLTLRDYVLTGCRDQLALEGELAETEAAMASGDEAAMTRYGEVLARFEAA